MSEYDFPEDFDQENGNYENQCVRCGHKFMGNKNRILCKVCDDKSLTLHHTCDMMALESKVAGDYTNASKEE